MKPRLLDLFCGAGGAAMGYHRAGFEVVGVDIKPHVVECLHAEIRRTTLFGLRQGPRCAVARRAADKPSLSPVRCQASCCEQAAELGQPRKAPTVEGWKPCDGRWVSAGGDTSRQPVLANGGRTGAGV